LERNPCIHHYICFLSNFEIHAKRTEIKAKVEAADASIRVALRMVGISEVKARNLTESKLPDFKD
jgi:hypothetical protein